jgi:hypothetical protein
MGWASTGYYLLHRAADKRERRKPDGLERAQEREKKGK